MSRSCRRAFRSFLVSFSITAASLGCAHRSLAPNPTGNEQPLRQDVFTPVTFIQHEEANPLATYLAQNVYTAPIDALRTDVEEREHVKLKSRGEAHITVVTPLEYDRVLKQRLTMARISQLARESEIQQIPFRPVCLGRVARPDEGKIQASYFLVVDSPGLLELRRKVRDAFVQAGGNADDFRPEAFEPHITVGFTDRDLHAEDGVTKDPRSCIRDLTLVAP